MLLIGSRALKLRNPNLIRRAPLDFDWICTEDEYNNWVEKNLSKLNHTKMYDLPEFNKKIIEGETNCEFEIIKPGSSNELLVNLVNEDKQTIDTSFGKIPNLDLLFTIKSSHKYKKFQNSDHMFWKTAIDYHMMQRAGATVRPEYNDFLKLRESETYTYKHPKLNTDKKNFFADYDLEYIFDHDSIHEAVKLQERPAYTYYIKDGEQVMCSKQKFLDAPIEIQLAGVMEEAATLALERSLIPHPGVWNETKAWQFALAKVCSSITSGWFRKFSFDNIFNVMDLYFGYRYFDRFKAGLNNGIVKPFTGSKY